MRVIDRICLSNRRRAIPARRIHRRSVRPFDDTASEISSSEPTAVAFPAGRGRWGLSTSAHIYYTLSTSFETLGLGATDISSCRMALEVDVRMRGAGAIAPVVGVTVLDVGCSLEGCGLEGVIGSSAVVLLWSLWALMEC